jgi:hypothetical protein
MMIIGFNLNYLMGSSAKVIRIKTSLMMKYEKLKFENAGEDLV